MERNPSYWKVDPKGNQLPYVDEVDFDVMQDTEVLLLKAAGGELDRHTCHINNNVNKPVLADAATAARYHLFDKSIAVMNASCFNFDLIHQNAALREIFGNKDFRIGMSLGFDRQSVIDAVYVSQGEAWQWAPRVETPWYDETLARQLTDLNIEQVNQYLDKVVPEKDGDGWRLRPDGKRLTIVQPGAVLF